MEQRPGHTGRGDGIETRTHRERGWNRDQDTHGEWMEQRPGHTGRVDGTETRTHREGMEQRPGHTGRVDGTETRTHRERGWNRDQDTQGEGME